MNCWHTHSMYSVLDGLSSVESIVARAKSIGAKVAVITDHASISAMPELMAKSKEAGIKPVIGCEFYVADQVTGDNMKGMTRYHLSVWAKNWDGVESIMAQLTLANEQFYRRPLLTFDQALQFKDCMIGTACTFGILSHPEYREIAGRFATVYGDDLYLEIMPHRVVLDGETIDRQQVVNERAIELSSQNGWQLLATNDSHYTCKEDAETHKILLAVQYGKTLAEFGGWGDGEGVFYMRTIPEMIEAFKALGYVPAEAISGSMVASVHMADKVCIELPKFDVHLPDVHADDAGFAQRILADGWKEKINGKVGDQAKVYHARLIYELDVIKRMGFLKYFLMVDDIIRWSREHGIMVGPGRGSAAGSLVCYLMGITQLDPIKHGLYFERFLNPERVNLPDIDVDFQDDRRQEVFEYIVAKYGQECVGQINTFGVMTIKSAFRDVSRVHGINNMQVNILSKQIEDEESFDKVPELSAFAVANPAVIKFTKKLAGTIRQVGVHACLAAESQLLTYRGYERIGALDGMPVMILTKNGMKPASVFCNGVKDIYRLSYAKSKYSNTKQSLLVTMDHPVSSENGFTKASDAVGLEMPIAWYGEGCDQFPVMAGWFWNDGHYGEVKGGNDTIARVARVYFTPEKDDVAKEMFASALPLRENGRADRFIIPVKFADQVAERFGEGFKAKNADKIIPVLLSQHDKILWLRGFMSANATVQRGTIRLKLTSLDLVKFIRDLLAELGISGAKIQTVKGKVCRFQNGDYQCNDSYNLEISNNGAFLYGHLIGFLQPYKQERIDKRWYSELEYVRTDKVYDFSVFTDEESDRNGYVDGVLVHNCGISISSRPLKEVCAVERRKDGVMVSCWDMRNCEKFGLLKMDILGLTTLSILEHARKLVKDGYGTDIVYTEIPLDDQKTMDMFSKGETAGVFQFEGAQMQELLRNLQANDFKTITATTALYRPGPLQAGLTDQFVKISQGRDYESYACPQLEPILSSTKSIMIYQEQIMRIFSDLGGFTWAQADQMRKIIGKKLGKDEFDKHRDNFVAGCEKNGIPATVSDSLFSDMAEFASYSFNLAHAAAYTMISLWCMYLKAHYPSEFIAAYMSCVKSEDSQGNMVAEAKRLGVPVERPDINRSTDKYILEDGKVLAPLGAIKGVGEKAVESILEGRKDGVFLSVEDMKARVYRRVVTVRVIDILERAGAFESLGVKEYNDEQREKNYAELLPMLNEVPALSLDRDHLEEEYFAAIIKQVDDLAAASGKKPLHAEHGTKPVIMAINMPVKGETKLLKNRGTKLFQSSLADFGITMKSIYYTSVLKEVIDTPAKAPKKTLAAGLEIVKQEVVAVNPKLIVCFATNAIPLFIPDGKIGKLNGKVVYNKTYDCYVMFSFSPQYAAYKTEEIGGMFEANMAKIYEMFGGGL